MLGVEIFCFRCHAQRVVIAAHLHALTATFAEIGNKNGEQTTMARILLLHGTEDRRHVAVCKRQLIDDAAKLLLGFI